MSASQDQQLSSPEPLHNVPFPSNDDLVICLTTGTFEAYAQYIRHGQRSLRCSDVTPQELDLFTVLREHHLQIPISVLNQMLICK